jgi:hypothetical protein
MRSLRHLRLDEALKVWEVATPKEQTEIRPQILAKIECIESYTPDQRAELVKQIRALPGLIRPIAPRPQGKIGGSRSGVMGVFR